MISHKKLTKKTLKVATSIAILSHQYHSLALIKKSEICHAAGVTRSFFIPYHSSLPGFLSYYHQTIAAEIVTCLKTPNPSIRYIDLVDIVQYYYPFFLIELETKSFALFSLLIKAIELNRPSKIPLENFSIGVFFSVIFCLAQQAEQPSSLIKQRCTTHLASALRNLIYSQ